MIVVKTILLLFFSISLSYADIMVTLTPSRDSTIYEPKQGGNIFANGAGQYLFAGRVGFDGGFVRRRTLLKFDVAATLPSGATITAAVLRLYVSKSPSDNGDETVGLKLHRLNKDWGEGASDPPGPEGQGTTPENDDATWISRFHNRDPAELWTESGAKVEDDYQAIESSGAALGKQLQYYTWPCKTALLADVQLWLDDPASNFGWILLGDDGGFSARRFNSRENNEFKPELVIYYTEAGTILHDTLEAQPVCAN